ncbi:MAG: DNA repair protein RecN [Oscillospiraceae bacterium]|nr:DNA repair protein RecN [Oscillospiraceae bacterium]
MLKSLNIENIAVIEKADIEFSPGLNVLTGETGAGKSIVVDSINAVLGERTSRELVRNGANEAQVTAVFDDINSSVREKLDEFGIEDDDTLVLMRKISDKGKSYCRINGVPCTVSMLRQLGEQLVNIHGQHDSQALLNPDTHYRFLDMFADDKELVSEYSKNFKKLLEVRKKLKSLTSDAENNDKQSELLAYEINELTQADIKVGEIEHLHKRKNIILNSQNISDYLTSILTFFNGDDENNAGAENNITSLYSQGEALGEDDSEISAIQSRLLSLSDSIAEIKSLAGDKLNSIEYNENELNAIDERLDMYYHLSNKYGATEQEMIDYLNDALSKQNAIADYDEELERLNVQYDEVYSSTVDAAKALSLARSESAKQLENEIKEQLEFLDMPKVKFLVDFKQGNLSSTGYDKIEFLISTNPGEPPKPLAKIASGGELSRIMLAIKNILAAKDTVDTLIFDEVDAGVSGRASRKIGLKLKSVGEVCQVICVTHSAQIASAADNHLLIQKEFKNDKTYTKVIHLDFEQRKRELARIMGGMEITDALLKSAEEMLNE